VIGTFVWDIIHGRDTTQAPIEEWGGITYALSALDAALDVPHPTQPDEAWEIVPLIRVGTDLAQRARDYLGTLRHLAPDAAPIEVAYPNNRVTIYYTSDDSRNEYLRGGIPAWSWTELEPLLVNIDALYINLISGFELDLDTARRIRQHFRDPIYCDLHSLLLAVDADGLRTPRTITNIPAWFQCFDILQVNEGEMKLLAPNATSLAKTAMRSGVSIINVTLGPQGVMYFAIPWIERLFDLHTASLRPMADLDKPIQTALVPAAPVQRSSGGDPTGCGDVWGATYFARLLVGDNLGNAISAALKAAARNVDHRGASGLASYLRGAPSVT